MTKDLNIILDQMDAINLNKLVAEGLTIMNTDIFDFEKLDKLVAEGLEQLDEMLTRDGRHDCFLSLGSYGGRLALDIKARLLAIQQMRT